MNELVAADVALADAEPLPAAGPSGRLGRVAPIADLTDRSQEEMDMTRYQPDRRRSAVELPLEMAYVKMAALRGETRRSRLADDGAPSGALRRIRDGLGLRLIALGSALLDERPHREFGRAERQPFMR